MKNIIKTTSLLALSRVKDNSSQVLKKSVFGIIAVVVSAGSFFVATVNAAAAPGAPTSVTATAGNAQATITFTAPASDGESAITAYTVTSSSTDAVVIAASTTSPIIVTGLTNGTPYTFTVTATNNFGTSSSSLVSNSVTPDGTAPTLTSVSISSNNASTTLAKAGDTVTVLFTASEALAEGGNEPVVKIGGNGIDPIYVTGSGTTWEVVYETSDDDALGPVPFIINFKDVAMNPGVQVSAATNGTSVTFDNTALLIDRTSPEDKDVGVSVNVAPRITFNKKLDPGTVSSTTVKLFYYGENNDVPLSSTVTLTEDNTVIVVTPNNPLNYYIEYYIKVSGVKDFAGNVYEGIEETIIFATARATAVASPVSGTFSSVQSVSLSATGSDSIRYSTDDSILSCSEGSVYSGVITVGSSLIIRAIACYSSSSASSSVSSHAYTINIPSSGGGGSRNIPAIPAAPEISPAVPATPTVPARLVGQVLGAETFNFTKTLRRGMRDSDVGELQKQLRSEGFFTYPTNTGFFGSVTQVAVKAFQAKYGIKQIGIVGPITRKQLNLLNVSEPVKNPVVGCSKAGPFNTVTGKVCL